MRRRSTDEKLALYHALCLKYFRTLTETMETSDQVEAIMEVAPIAEQDHLTAEAGPLCSSDATQLVDLPRECLLNIASLAGPGSAQEAMEQTCKELQGGPQDRGVVVPPPQARLWGPVEPWVHGQDQVVPGAAHEDPPQAAPHRGHGPPVPRLLHGRGMRRRPDEILGAPLMHMGQFPLTC